MRRTAVGVILLGLAVTGCGSGHKTPSKGATLCQDMTSQLATLSSISTAVHLQQQYATPQDAANAVSAVQANVAAIASRAGTQKVTDLAQPFSILVISIQEYEANLLSQDATAEPDVVSQLQTSTKAVTDACAHYTH